MMNEEMQKIINNIHANWSKDHVIRYLYVTLAPFFQRDVSYFLASEEEKYARFQKVFVLEGRNIVCSTLADFYVNLYTSLGIAAKKIICNSAKLPLFALIVEGTHGWFFLDPLNDLFSNQYRLKTAEFGKVPHYHTLNSNYPYLVTLSNEYIVRLDSDLGLDDTYDDFFTLLHLEMTNRYLVSKYLEVDEKNKLELFKKRMEFASEHLINLGNVEGPFERVRLYLFLENQLFYKTEKKNIKICLDKTKTMLPMHIEYTNFYDGSSMIFEEERKGNRFVLKKIK